MAFMKSKASALTQHGWGVLALSIWLIATGLMPLLKLDVPMDHVILPVLAIAAGVLLLMGR